MMTGLIHAEYSAQQKCKKYAHIKMSQVHKEKVMSK